LEPKVLGVSLVPFIIGYISVLKSDGKMFLPALFVFVMLLLTKSATGVVALLLMLILYGGVRRGFYGKIKSLTVLLVLVPMFVGSALFFAPIFGEALFLRIAQYYAGEYVSGVQMPIQLPIFGVMTFEGNDAPLLTLFLDSPWTVFTGVGLGQESFYAYKYLWDAGGMGFLGVDYTGYITSTMAILTNISNYGLFLLLFMIGYGVRAMLRFRDEVNSSKLYVKWFFLSHFFIGLLVFKTVFPVIFSFAVLIGLLENDRFGRQKNSVSVRGEC